MKATTEKDQREINWAMGFVAKKIHGAPNRYRIPEKMHLELDILREILSDENIMLETPIAHIVPMEPTFTAITAATPTKIFGWSTDLNFWWSYDVSPDITRRLVDKSVRREKRIKLDVLKMAGLVLNFAAAIHACHKNGIETEGYPVLLNTCDGISSNIWVNYRCKTSLAGRALGRLFVGLLMTTKIGVQAEWEPEFEPEGSAKLRNLIESDHSFDFLDLLNVASFPISCHQFQPSLTLLGMISDCIGRNASPDVRTLKALEPNALGRIISSDT